MRTHGILLGMTTAIILCSATVARADENAAREFARGKSLLATGDFDGALVAFKGALKAEPENEEYFQQCALLRRVIQYRAQLKVETDAEAWQQIARGLYSFYCNQKLYGEAVPLARTMFEKAKSADSAGLLGDALLATGKNDDAATLLVALTPEESSPHTTALRGVALARTGKLGEAKAVAAQLEIPKDCDADLCYDAARLYALVGQTDKAIEMLKCSFETTPADQLDAAKAVVKESTDLAKLTVTPEFAKVMQTESKGSGCGSKAACAKCPLKDKGGCEKGKAGDAKEGKAAGCEHDKK